VGSSYSYSRKNLTGEVENSAIASYYQSGKINIKEHLILIILRSLLGQRFFTQLRTVEQLGYIVFASSFTRFSSDGFVFVIQSDVKSPNYLDERIEAFLADVWMKDLANMTAIDFEDVKKAVKSELQVEEDTLDARAENLWAEIDSRQFIFNRSGALALLSISHRSSLVSNDAVAVFVEKLKSISIHDIKVFSSAYFFNHQTRRKLRYFSQVFVPRLLRLIP